MGKFLQHVFETGWEWTCRHCGHVNRGTDSSLLCEKCGTPR